MVFDCGKFPSDGSGSSEKWRSGRLATGRKKLKKVKKV